MAPRKLSALGRSNSEVATDFFAEGKDIRRMWYYAIPQPVSCCLAVHVLNDGEVKRERWALGVVLISGLASQGSGRNGVTTVAL